MEGAPKSTGRNERHGEARSRSQLARRGAVQRTALAHDHTGAFGSFRKPKLVGVSDVVRVANRDMAKAARRAEKQWRRSLPKGVKV